MEKKPFEETHNLHRLLLATAIVAQGQGDAIGKIFHDNEAYFTVHTHGRGTAPSTIIDMLGLSDTKKTIVFSVVKEDRWPIIRQALEQRFSVSKLSKGICYALPLDAVMGVSAYKMLSNSGFAEIKESRKRHFWRKEK